MFVSTVAFSVKISTEVNIRVYSPRLLDGLTLMSGESMHASMKGICLQLVLSNELLDWKILPVLTVLGPFDGVADVIRYKLLSNSSETVE